MGKFVFFAVFLAALVAASVAQSVPEQRFRDAQCRREVQENPLYACRQVVDRQLTGPGRVAGAVPFQWGARARCCQQLQGVSRECRCAAIRRMVRNYEQTMPPLEEGYGGAWPAERQEQGYYGETTEQQRQQQEEGQGYYGEAAERQQQGSERYYGETSRRQQGQQQGEEGYYGKAAGRQQGEEVYGGERSQRQQQGEEGYYGEAAGRQQGEEVYGGERSQRQQQLGEEGYYGEAAGRQQGEEGYGGERRAQQVTRVRLTKVRQYVARLPNMCQMEPLECSVFSYDQY